MNPLTFLLLLFVGSGLLLTVIAIPLVQRRIKPNLWYGFRTKRTLSNAQVRYEVNAYAGKRLFASGIVTVLAALGLYLVPGLTVEGYTLGMTIFALGPLTIALAQSFRYLKQLDE